MADETKRIGGGTSPYEAVLERKRAAIRRAMKMQYIKTVYDPRNYNRDGSSIAFDSNMARWQAMMNTRPQFFYPTVRNLAWFAISMVIPVGIIFSSVSESRNRWTENVMNGVWPYDHPERVKRWKLY